MAKTTYYAVQCFEIGARGKLVSGSVFPANSEQHAVRMAFRLEPKYAGVIAFSQDADAEAGDYDEPVLLKVLGAVPEEVSENAPAAAA